LVERKNIIWRQYARRTGGQDKGASLHYSQIQPN
jgi:hypothetical protein